jgi:hypothetical protein
VCRKALPTDHRKIDAKLASALRRRSQDDATPIDVFVHLTPGCGPQAAAKLNALGVRGVGSGRSVFTARLSADEIAELSDQPYVRQLRLAQTLKLRPSDGER